MSFGILGLGSYVPQTAVCNAQVEARLQLEPGWIERRTGILMRHYAAETEATSDLAIAAGKAAMQDAGVSGKDIGMVLLATSTPDYLLPPTAPMVANALDICDSGAMDLMAACAGFLYALSLADSHVRTRGRCALVIGANVLSRRVNLDDPTTAALFSDGAGAVVYGPVPDNRGMRAINHSSDGSRWNSIYIPGGGSRKPFTPESLHAGEQYMLMERGKRLFRSAAMAMKNAGLQAMEECMLTMDDIDWWIPHQANARVLKEAAHQMGLPPAKTVNVLDTFGNSSSATIPIAMDEWRRKGHLKPGNNLLLTAVGAGLVSGGAVIVY